MSPNSFIHISCTILGGEYSPGVVTAALLYLPGGIFLLARWARMGALAPGNIMVSFAVGGLVFMLIPTFARAAYFHAEIARLFHLVK
jgi:hypothetical protein